MTYISKQYFCLLTIIIFLLSGCAAVGVTYKSDPWAKLDDAYQMMEPEGRFIRAKQFIEEAEKIFMEEGNKKGLAETYHTYGNFYRHGPVGEYKNKYLDIEKSRSYFERAYNLYDELDDDMGRSKCLLGIAMTLPKGDNIKKCEYYKRSLQVYYDGKKKNPAAVMPILVGKDYPSIMNLIMEEEGCK